MEKTHICAGNAREGVMPCGLEKLLTEEFFYKANSKLGFSPVCKECTAKMNKAYNQRKTQEKKERVAETITPQKAKSIETSLKGGNIVEAISSKHLSNEEPSVDIHLKTKLLPYYYFLLGLPEDDNGIIQITQSPRDFVKTFGLAPIASIELFHIYAEYTEEGFKWKKPVGTINSFVNNYKSLISISGLRKSPTTTEIGEDLKKIMELQLRQSSQLAVIQESIANIMASFNIDSGKIEKEEAGS